MKSIFTTALASAALVAFAEAQDLGSLLGDLAALQGELDSLTDSLEGLGVDLGINTEDKKEDPAFFNYVGNTLIDNTRVELANNKITGNQIINTRDRYGYFYRPSTIWDGCVRRAPLLDAETPKTSWWTLQ